jgi:hypothetical protein
MKVTVSGTVTVERDLEINGRLKRGSQKWKAAIREAFIEACFNDGEVQSIDYVDGEDF